MFVVEDWKDAANVSNFANLEIAVHCITLAANSQAIHKQIPMTIAANTMNQIAVKVMIGGYFMTISCA